MSDKKEIKNAMVNVETYIDAIANARLTGASKSTRTEMISHAQSARKYWGMIAEYLNKETKLNEP